MDEGGRVFINSSICPNNWGTDKRRGIMKKIILASVLSLVLLVAFGLEAKAEPAKEGAYAFTAIYSGTLKSLAMGEERVQITYELMGVHVSDTGEGLLHNASYRGLGVIHAVKGTLEYSRGMLVFNLPDGDQAFIIYEGTGKLGGPSKFTILMVRGLPRKEPCRAL